MRRLMAIMTVLLGMVGLLADCGSSDDSNADGASSTGSGAKPLVIDITFNGKSVTPNGDRVNVKAGQNVEFLVKADSAGQIHVRSTPKKQFDYNAGTTEIRVGSFGQPGLVKVESRTLNKTIVQLQIQ